MSHPTNVKEHVEALIRRTNYDGETGAIDMALCGIPGPLAMLSGVRYLSKEDADRHENFVRDILEKELTRAETRGRAQAFCEAAERVKAIVGDLKIIEELQKLAAEADALDCVKVRISASLSPERRAELVSAYEEDHPGRVRVVEFEELPSRQALKKKTDFLREIAEQALVVEGMPKGVMAFIQNGEVVGVAVNAEQSERLCSMCNKALPFHRPNDTICADCSPL